MLHVNATKWSTPTFALQPAVLTAPGSQTPAQLFAEACPLLPTRDRAAFAQLPQSPLGSVAIRLGLAPAGSAPASCDPWNPAIVGDPTVVAVRASLDACAVSPTPILRALALALGDVTSPAALAALLRTEGDPRVLCRVATLPDMTLAAVFARTLATGQYHPALLPALRLNLATALTASDGGAPAVRAALLAQAPIEEIDAVNQHAVVVDTEAGLRALVAGITQLGRATPHAAKRFARLSLLAAYADCLVLTSTYWGLTDVGRWARTQAAALV